MGTYDIKKRTLGFIIFFFSGICAISSGIIVNLLQEKYGFAYGMTGTLLALMSIGNLVAGFVVGILPSKLGMKRTIIVLASGYGIGYWMMGLSGEIVLLMLAFLLVGIAKGSTINICTILVGDNSPNRIKGMNVMHSCYALGALLCPFVIAAAIKYNNVLPMFALAISGLVLWLLFVLTPLTGHGNQKNGLTDWSFLKSEKFWLLTGLLFFQNAAETSVTGWMVTYFKDSGIIAGVLSTYTVTVLWGSTLVARLLIAFVLPIKNTYSAMIKMGAACTLFYLGLMLANEQTVAIVLLFAFAFAMAGMNPMAVASAGRMTHVTSMGVMLPVASSGAILMPWMIGMVAEHAGIGIGMASNIIPCIGMLLFSVLVKRLSEREKAGEL